MGIAHGRFLFFRIILISVLRSIAVFVFSVSVLFEPLCVLCDRAFTESEGPLLSKAAQSRGVSATQIIHEVLSQTGQSAGHSQVICHRQVSQQVIVRSYVTDRLVSRSWSGHMSQTGQSAGNSPGHMSQAGQSTGHSQVLPLFLVVVFSDWEMISWSVVSVACYLMALVIAIYAFRHVSFLIS